METSMATQEEFLRLLDRNPEFRQQVRRYILSAELIELPEHFAAFASSVNEFIAEQRETNARQREFNTRVDGRLDRVDGRLDRVDGRLDQMDGRLDQMDGRLDQMDGRLDQMDGRLDQMDGRLDQMDGHLDRIDGRLKTLTDDMGTLKGNVVSRATRDHVDSILSLLDLEYVNILYRRDLVAMLSQATNIPMGHRQSFYRADLMLQAVDADGTTHYVATEASYTADRRDTDRALRNAEFLKRCTGCPAHAVISSVKNDHEVQSLVDEGTVRWYQLTDKDLNPE